MQTAVI